MKRLAALAATGTLLLAAAAPASASGCWARAAARTADAKIVDQICTGHHINDHYWRVGFCTGDLVDYPQVSVGDTVWTAHDHALAGIRAREALARGTQPIIVGYDIICYWECK